MAQPYQYIGAVHAVSKEVTTLINTTYINADTIIDFLHQLKSKYTDLPIFIVMDNARYQDCALVKETAQALGIIIGNPDSAVACYKRLFRQDTVFYKYCYERMVQLNIPKAIPFEELIFKDRKRISVEFQPAHNNY